MKELSDPLRLRVVDRLGHAGAATVSRLAAELDVPLPQLSNHLRRLREAGLVSVERSGRQATYALADPGLSQLLVLLDSVTGRVVNRPAAEMLASELPSRTCYDHLGGAIGVSIYHGLRERDGVKPGSDGVVKLGPAAEPTFAALGVDIGAVRPHRQRFAFECLDATERAPHLAGALADAVAQALVERRWIARQEDSRTITLTKRGARGLKLALGLELRPTVP